MLFAPFFVACSHRSIGLGEPAVEPAVRDTGSPPETVDSVVPWFDPPQAVMDGPFTLTIGGGFGAKEVRYTLDFTDPRTSSTSQVYTGPLAVDDTTVVRAVAMGDAGALSDVRTGTWILPERAAEQAAPPGWPDTWFQDYGSGGYNTAWYGLEPEVTEADPEALVDALRALPVLSIVIDPADLWGASGLYDHAWEEGETWERPINVAFLDGDEGFEADAGLRAYGGASRNPDSTPKKSFRVAFRSAYGDGHLDAPLYGEDAEIDGFIARAGYNNTWVHWDPDQRLHGQLLHDRMARAGQEAMGWASSRGRFVHLFIDGLYWGVYDVTERPDAHFFAAAYGTDDASRDPSAWDVLNSGEAIDGDLSAWERALGVARADDGSDASLGALEAEVDADALIDYMLLNFWSGNTDWPWHNWYAGRLRQDGRWRFASWDAEHTIEDASTDVTTVSDAGTPAELFAAFCRHPAFVERLAARAEELTAAGGALAPDTAVARYDALADELAPAMLAESARWGSYRRDVFCYAEGPCPLYTVGGDWTPERERITTEILPARAAALMTQLRARGWVTTPER